MNDGYNVHLIHWPFPLLERQEQYRNPAGKSLQINFSNRFPTSWKLAYFPRQVNFKDAAAEPEENRATVWGHHIPVIGEKTLSDTML